MRRDIHQAITERFIEQLKRGTVPWQKPWLSVQNIVSRKPYRGINALLLGSTDYRSPFWITFKQAFDLGAAFLSNEAGILDQVRFENSTAYLASWVEKFENNPRMIVSAASQAQRSTDFVLGIEPKESLQECQVSPEGMPLTWAQEHGIDTRIASFAQRNPEGEGVSTPTEWKQGTKPSERLSRPPQPGLGL